MIFSNTFEIETFCSGAIVPHALRIGSWNVGFPKKEETEGTDETAATEEIDESVVTEVADESVVPEETEKEEPQQTPPKQEEPTTSNQSTATTTTKKLTKRQQQTQENKRKRDQAKLQKEEKQEAAKLKKKQKREEEQRKKKEEKEQAVLQKKQKREEAKLKKKQEEEEEKGKKKRKYIDYCKESKCDVIALQETNNYILQQDVENDGFTLIKFEKSEEWRNYPSVGRSGKSSDRGLAFLICNSEISLVNAVQPHPRMAYLEFKFKDVDVILMNLYAVTADTNDKSQEDALAFFRYITNFIAEKNFPGILVLCGDLNAFPDQASSGLYEPFVGKNVYGSSNDHGKRFVEFLMSAELLHLNSRFAKPRNQKWTHKAKPNGAETEVDGFLSSRTDIVQDVDTFVQTSPSDHRLIASLWCISKEYESRRKHSRINTKTLWNKYKADLGELVSLASVGRYTELVDRVLSAAPPENSPMRIFTEQFAKNDFEAYLRNAHKRNDHINSSKKDTVGRSQVESRMRRHQFMPEDVQRELEKLENFKTPGMDKITSNMIKYGGAEMVTAATELFNQILNSDGCDVPQAWKTVLFGSPLQTVFPQTKTENIVFDERVCPLVHFYSNLLAELSFEMHQKERDMKNLFTISLLLERYSSEPYVYLLFAKFKKPMESVKVSSVLEGLEKSPIHPKIKTAFSSLLSNPILLFKDEPVDEKPIGIYLGDLASSMLLGFVIEMIIDGENGNDKNTELKFGEKILRRIVWDDMIVLIGKNVDQLHTQAEKIDKLGRNHNLRLDTDSMVFMADQEEILRSGRNLTVNAKTISVSKFPSVTHRNWTLVAAEKVAGASKCKDGTKIGIQKRTRQIKTIISKKTILWKVSFLKKWQNEAFERFHGLPENNQEKIMKGFRDQPFAFHKRPEWKAKAEAFFKESVIPMFFENCCVWNFNEFSFVKDACSSFLKMLNIPNFPFNPRWYILTKQALFISSLKEENLLFEMAGKNWIKEVNEASMGFNKTDVLENLKNKQTWEHFQEYCKMRIYV
ncbi:Protein CBG26850 [Caenorhabditis briggsae]|uniref:Protein CBG26850 n=1 Tax=Caenorhabditis briggsae TaxID=6238 RepID=B6ILZ5_CAEBR|nr:Protein CBG26850 [Caenorhabditis briggsae]CAS00925.1 Protein CBG26850 [Caenorhabditis briggsae]